MQLDLFAVAGDLGFERRRSLESIQRLSSLLLNPHQQVLPFEIREEVISRLEALIRSTEKIGSLTKQLEESLFDSRLVNVENLFQDLSDAITSESNRTQKPVVIEARNHDLKIDELVFSVLKPILIKLMSPFIEYCIESKKERLARSKSETAKILIDIQPVELGHKIKIVCDGNGVIPPFSEQFGRQMAKIGVRARFDGKPGSWSSWTFMIPFRTGAMKMLPITIHGTDYCIPAWAVTQIKESDSKAKYLLEVSIGLKSKIVAVDELKDPVDCYMKNLKQDLSANGKFLGVVQVINEQDMLCLVLSPEAFVYGDVSL